MIDIIYSLDDVKISDKHRITRTEPEQFKGLDYDNSQLKVLESGLVVPTIKLFIQHLVNVINAYSKDRILYDGNNKELSEREINDIYKHLTTDYINGGAWSFLNARFVEGSGFKDLDLETIIGLNKKGKRITKREPLQECLWEDCYVELEFNEQGLPTKKSDKQEYIQGENISYWHPRKDSVAWFIAVSDWACLDCFWNPGYADSALGVFLVAEGAKKNKK